MWLCSCMPVNREVKLNIMIDTPALETKMALKLEILITVVKCMHAEWQLKTDQVSHCLEYILVN